MAPADPLIAPEVRVWLAGADLAVKGSYRIDEVMRLLDVSRRTIYTMIERGDLDTVRTNPDGQRATPTRIPFPSVAALLSDD
ncbi:helix-turn-helix domain-containing protein [uncultured Thiodictyon sp.]|uniref:helix-turn-helix domain-containing protein n=1 Tax=uncultured Thiodictyon sp. TaxID=1846217 RepID=UPI0025EE3375|nr:helix-turn-helix domain-containing protein [uncultured Thiodictyon sp.]